MGNQLSISSNKLKKNEIEYHPNSNIQTNIKQLNENAYKNYNIDNLKDKGYSSSNLDDKSEFSSSDIIMKETNESIKSVDDFIVNIDNVVNLNCLRDKNLKNPQNALSNSNLNKNIFVKIVWNEDGENVFISGNFVNWNQWFYLNKKDKSFEIVFVNFFLIFKTLLKKNNLIFFIYKK